MGFRLDDTTEFLKIKYATTTPHHVGHWPQNARCWNTKISLLHTFTYTFFFPQRNNDCLQQSLMSSSSLSNKAVFKCLLATLGGRENWLIYCIENLEGRAPLGTSQGLVQSISTDFITGFAFVHLQPWAFFFLTKVLCPEAHIGGVTIQFNSFQEIPQPLIQEPMDDG